MPRDREASYIDAGLNVASSQFDEDRYEVLERAKLAGVRAAIAIGGDIDSTRRCLALAETDLPCPLYTTAGIHPHNANQATIEALAHIRQFSASKHVVAIGEMGLDYNRNFSTPAEQRRAFSEQLDIAVEVQKPVYLHERDAFTEQLNILDPRIKMLCGGLAHCFTGTPEQARAYLDRGLFIGITGWLCDPKRGQALRDAVAYIPLDRLILETDAPYLLPRHLKKSELAIPKPRRNEPALLPHIASYLAELKHCSVEDLADHSFRNCCQLFQLPSMQ